MHLSGYFIRWKWAERQMNKITMKVFSSGEAKGSSCILWIESNSANSYKTACLSRPDNCLLSAPHLCLLLFFLHYFLSRSLSLESQWCWSLVNEYLGPLPHGEPDLLARFYGPFQSCPSLNTASCWPHGHNVVPCPSGEEKGGGGTWTRAKKVLLRPQAYVAMWKQAEQGEKENSGFLFWHPELFVSKS